MPDQTRNLNNVPDFSGTLDSNDRLIMTDKKASLKALTTAILGKAIVEGYTGSSLAGASQSVKSAVDALNSKTKAYDYTAQSGSFLDWVLSTFTTNGDYYVIYATTNWTGWAGSNTGICKVIRRNNDYYLEAYIADTSTATNQSFYVNRKTGGSWLGWTKIPSRYEIETLKSKLWADIPLNNATQYTETGVYITRMNYDDPNNPANSSGFVLTYIHNSENYVQYAFSISGGIWSRTNGGAWSQLC